VEAVAYGQVACFDAAVIFARAEGIIPAPESSHAVMAAIAEAKQADAEGKTRVILFNLSGHGYLDLAAYDAHFAGALSDFDYPSEAVEQAKKNLPVVEA
jgi:tryptophan synthase beta chain